jgi:hypothetical protein
MQSRDFSEEQVDSTAQHNNRPMSTQPSSSGPTLLSAANIIRQDLAHALITQSLPAPAIITGNENNTTHQRMISQPVNQLSIPIPKPFPINYTPDKAIITQSLPVQNNSTTSLTYSPIINAALNQHPSHQFLFNANPLTKPSPPVSSITRTSKNNPTPRINRTRNILAQPDPKIDPTKPELCMNQIRPSAMDTQTEKKRRRENEKEVTESANVTQHFLTAGPGSQACQDQ